MNNRREHYYPLIGYVLLLVIVWLASWLIDIVATFVGVDLGIASLVSSEGVRWAVRNALPSLKNVAWGEIMLAVSAAGLLNGSGLFRLFMHIPQKKRLTRMETRSFLFSLFALMIYASVLYIITMSQWNILLGVTGSFSSSAFMYGLPLLLFIGVLIQSMIYGFMYGNYRTAIDVVSTIGDTCKFFVPALLALIPAAGITSSIEYIGVFDGLTDSETSIITTVFYSIPFLHILWGKIKT